MDTKLVTKQIRLREWAEVIKDCKSSGLKVDDYCSQHGLSRDAYYYWLRKVKEAALLQAGFVEMPAVRSGPSGFIPQMQIKIGDIEIDINKDTPGELISSVLGVIRHA